MYRRAMGTWTFDNIYPRAEPDRVMAGPLSIEWEDSGMERVFGGTEACEFTKQINFETFQTWRLTTP